MTKTISVLGIDGKAKGRITLPAGVFGVKPNKQLMAQAVRVYLANQREGGAATKTRGKVEGSTRKIYRQKGTGRARHGSIRAPIFVGGGIVFGPVPHSFSKDLPVKMKRNALVSALSSQFAAGNIIVVDGLAGLENTKSMAKTLANVGAVGKILLALSDKPGNAFRVARNIEGVEGIPAKNLNTYAVLVHQKLVFMKDAIGLL